MADIEDDPGAENAEEEEGAPPKDGKSSLERLLFALVVVIAMFCGLETQKSYEKWKKIPTVVTFNDRPIEVSKIPFPAVTICSENRVRKLVIDIESESSNLRSQIAGSIPFKSQEQKDLVDAASLQCFSKIYPHEAMLPTTTIPNATLFKILATEITPPWFTYECSFLKNRSSCKEMFKPILTDYGLCYTFNMLDDHELYTTRQQNSLHFPLVRAYHSTWDLELGYETDHVSEHDYPRRTGRDVGHDSGLRVWFLMNKDGKDRQQFCSAGHPDSFRVLLHLPSEFPSMLHGKYIQVSPGTASHVTLKPQYITTPIDLRDDKRYNSTIRGCFFPEERNLSLFKTYTMSNCELNCVNEVYRKHCACQLYYYPLEKGSNSTLCPNINKQIEFCNNPSKLNAYNIMKDVKDRRKCACLPSCHEIIYNYEHTTARMEISPRFKLNAGYAFAELAIFFEEHLVIAQQRNELFSLDVFGLVGILTGFSVISGSELVYFLIKKFIDCIKSRKKPPPSPTPVSTNQPSASASSTVFNTIGSLITPENISSIINVINENK